MQNGVWLEISAACSFSITEMPYFGSVTTVIQQISDNEI